MKYLQKEFEDLPKGTPLIECAPDNAHVWAKAVLGGDITPRGHYRLPGSDEVFSIPRFQMLVDDTHPNDPSVVGPFIYGGMKVDFDTLPSDTDGSVSCERAYPFVYVTVCVDPHVACTEWIDPTKIRIDGSLKDLSIVGLDVDNILSLAVVAVREAIVDLTMSSVS